jgi:hypothetical protein
MNLFKFSFCRTVLRFCLSLLHLAKSKNAKTVFRVEEEEVEDSRGSLLAANVRLASDLCLTFSSLRSGRSKEVTGHLAVATRWNKVILPLLMIGKEKTLRVRHHSNCSMSIISITSFQYTMQF